MKIAVLGFSGSGKSTLARTLAEGLGCPVLHLDRIQFVSGWKLRDRGEAAALAEEFLDAHDSWVIDGNYKTFSQERRLREADSILFLNFSRWSCLLRVIRRSLRYRGGTGRIWPTAVRKSWIGSLCAGSSGRGVPRRCFGGSWRTGRIKR